jgi:signal recognition particle subunit SRP19
MSSERIIYPCYFDATLMRREGRRVPRNSAVKSPTLQELESALRRMKVQYRLEDHHHPAQWADRRGRIVVEWEGSKERLLKTIAGQLGSRK